MIDEKYQGKGYGTAAMALLTDFIKTKPGCCEAEFIYLAHMPVNHIAAKMCTGLGFEKTGQILEGEVVMRLALW